MTKVLLKQWDPTIEDLADGSADSAESIRGSMCVRVVWFVTHTVCVCMHVSQCSMKIL